MGRNHRNHSKRYAVIAGGRMRGSWTGTAEHSNCRACSAPPVNLRFSVLHESTDSLFASLDSDTPPTIFPPTSQRIRGAIDLYFKGMQVHIRSREMDRRKRRHSFTVQASVRELASRMPTIVLLEELAARAEMPSTAFLLDALQTHGHELGEPLAELLQQFTEKVAMLRRANAVEGKDGDNS